MAPEATIKTSTSPGARGSARPFGARGQRLAEAFDRISSVPALDEARGRLLALGERGGVSSEGVVAAVESDAALTIAVMRAANNGSGPRGRAGGVREAVAALSPAGVIEIAARVDTYDPLAPAGPASDDLERFRRHGNAVRVAAVRVGALARLTAIDELALAALLHDVGRLVLGELYGREFGMAPEAADGPARRLHNERRELGIDHALVGAVLARRWGLPAAVASAVERHHAPDAEGLAAAVQIADLVVHYAAGDKVAPEDMRAATRRLGIDDDGLRGLLFDFPHAGESRPRAIEPCPLSAREIDALKGLAGGKVYKQIAQELSVSVSTVRTHLHNVYKKIGAVDRAQAVLLARDRGWL